MVICWRESMDRGNNYRDVNYEDTKLEGVSDSIDDYKGVNYTTNNNTLLILNVLLLLCGIALSLVTVNYLKY